MIHYTYRPASPKTLGILFRFPRPILPALLLKQRIESAQQLFQGLRIGRRFKPNAVIPGDGFPVIHLVLPNGLRDAVGKSITGRKTFSVRQTVFVLILAYGT